MATCTSVYLEQIYLLASHICEYATSFLWSRAILKQLAWKRTPVQVHLHPTMHDLLLLQFNWRNSSLFPCWNPEQVTSHGLDKAAAAHHHTHSFCLAKTPPSLLHFHSQQCQWLEPIFPPCRLACSDNSVCAVSTAQPCRPWAKTVQNTLKHWVLKNYIPVQQHSQIYRFL